MAIMNLHEEVVDSISAPVSIIDTGGVILETNRAWREFGDENGMNENNESVGMYYFSICGSGSRRKDDDASRVAEGISKVISGEAGEFITHSPCHYPDHGNAEGVDEKRNRSTIGKRKAGRNEHRFARLAEATGRRQIQTRRNRL